MERQNRCSLFGMPEGTPPDDPSWRSFVEEWGLGVAPAEGPVETLRAIATLRRLWPCLVHSVQSGGTRGIQFIAPLIHLGRVLADTEKLPGFDTIFQRLRESGELAAQAELTVAALLCRTGYPPTLEPPMVGEHVLDSVVSVAGHRVFIEVVSPEESAYVRSVKDRASQLSSRLMETTGTGQTDLHLDEGADESEDEIVSAVLCVPADGTRHKVDGVGEVRRYTASARPIGGAVSAGGAGSRGPVLGLARTAGTADGSRTSVNITVPVSDDRVLELLHRKRKQLPVGESNLIIVHVTRALSVGIEWWAELVERRWFQPGINTRVGAVALFDEAVAGRPPALRARWRAVVNPHAKVPIPDAFIAALRGFDEPWDDVPNAEQGISTPLLLIPGIGVISHVQGPRVPTKEAVRDPPGESSS